MKKDALVQVLLATAARTLRSLCRVRLGHALVVAIVRADGQDDVAPIVLQLVGEVLRTGLNVEILEIPFSHADIGLLKVAIQALGRLQGSARRTCLSRSA